MKVCHIKPKSVLNLLPKLVPSSVEKSQYIRVFSKIEYSGNAVRIVLEQNKFSKKVTSNRD